MDREKKYTDPFAKGHHLSQCSNKGVLGQGRALGPLSTRPLHPQYRPFAMQTGNGNAILPTPETALRRNETSRWAKSCRRRRGEDWPDVRSVLDSLADGQPLGRDDSERQFAICALLTHVKNNETGNQIETSHIVLLHEMNKAPTIFSFRN